MRPACCRAGDLTRQPGQVKRGDVEQNSDPFFSGISGRICRQEQERLETLKLEIEKMIEQSPSWRSSKQMLLDITSEGLRIQIVDEQNRPMFDSAVPI